MRKAHAYSRSKLVKEGNSFRYSR